MKGLDFGCRMFGIAASVTLLSCCESQTIIGGPGAASKTSPVAVEPSGSKSWMLPQATGEDLLYVSGSLTSDVYVYSYPQGNLVGTLTGVASPQGLCSDKQGDIFIANGRATTITEFSHGGTTPINTLQDPNYWPEGCAVDPTSGNLAVTDNSNGAGGVAIYKHAVGSPGRHRAPHFAYYFFCGYDASGNLFVDGADYSSSPTFEMAELPKGKGRFETFTLNQSIQWPGGVQFHDKYLAVGDAAAGVVYEFSVAGNAGKLQRTTYLLDSNTVNQFWIQAPRVVGANQYNPSIMFWNYPLGGHPRKTILTHHKRRQLFGVTVSLAN